MIYLGNWKIISDISMAKSKNIIVFALTYVLEILAVLYGDLS
jgi:hypothetical protein